MQNDFTHMKTSNTYNNYDHSSSPQMAIYKILKSQIKAPPIYHPAQQLQGCTLRKKKGKKS